MISISRKAPLKVKASSGIGKIERFFFFARTLAGRISMRRSVSNSLSISTEFRPTEEVGGASS